MIGSPPVIDKVGAGHEIVMAVGVTASAARAVIPVGGVGVEISSEAEGTPRPRLFCARN